MEKARVNIDPFKSVEEQVKEVVKAAWEGSLEHRPDPAHDHTCRYNHIPGIGR